MRNCVNKIKRLRQMLSSPKTIVRAAGAHDGMSARLVEKSRMDAVWASSLEISTSYGVPDTNILSMKQYLERTMEMQQATSLPIIADCSIGYKDNDNIFEMIRQYAAAGIAAVTIEEKKLPRFNSLIHKRQKLLCKEEFAETIRKIKKVKGVNMLLIARVEAFIAGKGLQEALARSLAYAQAGADAILIHSRLPQPDEIRKFTAHWNNQTPLAVIPTTYYKVTLKELKDMGIKMVIYANHGIRAAAKATESVLRNIIEDGGSASVEGKIASLDEIFKLQLPLGTKKR
jgi:phosphoenolpyruvate phosphomutase